MLVPKTRHQACCDLYGDEPDNWHDQSNFIYFYRLILEVFNCQNLNTELLKQVGWGKSNVAPEQRMRLKGESLSAAGTSLVLLDLRHPQQIPLTRTGLWQTTLFQRNSIFKKYPPTYFKQITEGK